jgi:UDP-GlcNAc:undecaprenyl-phosphate GlcNAc-1-phosphate transferase
MLTLTPIAGFAVAFVLACALTPLVRRLAFYIGAVDHTLGSKIHEHDIPRLGGVAIVIAFYVPVLALAFRINAYQDEIYSKPRPVIGLLVGGLVILALGIYDDVRRASATQKFIVQVPVAMFAWWMGIRIGGTSAPGGEVLVFSQAVSLAVTVLWIVGVVNALNLIDGLDGLASGIALQALLAAAVCAWHRDELSLALFAICLSGAVGGFLMHNFHPASVFMGDSGSMFLGYVLAVAAVWSSQKAATAIGIVLPAVALGLPLLDTSLAIWRRWRTHRPVFSPDLDHIHHRLLAIGWSQPRTVLTLYFVGLFFSALSVALVFSNDARLGWPMVVLGVAVALGLARWLGYLSPATTAGGAATQRKNLMIQRALHILERRLRRADSEEAITRAVAEFDVAADHVLGAAPSEAERGVRFAVAARVAAARARRLP